MTYCDDYKYLYYGHIFFFKEIGNFLKPYLPIDK